MTKKYVLDTNVLLSDPDSIFKFEDNDIVIPMTVLEEVDKFKKEQSELGRNARQISRNLDELRKIGQLDKGVTLESGGFLKVSLVLSRVLDRLPYDLDENMADNRILAVAIDCKGILVSKDINLRIKANSIGIEAQDYQNDKIKSSSEGLYTGFSEIITTSEVINNLYSHKYANIEGMNPYPNQCFVLKSDTNEKHSALVRYNSVMNEYRLIEDDLKTMGIQPRNTEQQFALSLLLDQNIKLVTLSGKAGSGKGLLSLSAALKGVLEDKIYEKIVIARPIVSLNNAHQIGYLPGSLEDKLSQWLKPFYENINFIMSSYTKAVKPQKVQGKSRKKRELDYNEEEKEVGITTMVDELMAFDLLELASLESIKGRSLHNQIVLITEAQDCTLADIKAIVTRIGEGSKIVLEGDTAQCDNPYLNEYNNGLTHVAEKFKEYDIAAHITLQHSERSKLAELAADIL